MNIAELQRKLIAVARLDRPSEAIPFAFEKRVMARLASETVFDPWTVWNRLLWRAAAPCVAIMLAMGVWAALFADTNGSAESLAAELEQAVLAPLAQLENSW